MIAPVIPENEKERIEALKRYQILDTLCEEEYDAITKIASHICKTPISVISLIDSNRQWFKSHHGLDATETPRELAFCAHAINTPGQMFEISDAKKDERFHDNPLVVGGPNVIFYAGMPLVSEDELALGTLCVIDSQPNKLTIEQAKTLKELSIQVVKLMELRRSQREILKVNEQLERQNKDLERFAYVAAHDIKSPLNNISGLVEAFTEDFGESINKDGIQLLQLINGSARELKKLVEGILNYSRSDTLLLESREKVNLQEFFDELIRVVDPKGEHLFLMDFPMLDVAVNKIAFHQIVINLITNAIKYNDKDGVEIYISMKEDNENYLCSIQDNGTGIAPENQQKIFEQFKTLKSEDRYGDKGSGIGLSLVKKLVEGQKGTICLESELKKGTTFHFSFQK